MATIKCFQFATKRLLIGDETTLSFGDELVVVKRPVTFPVALLRDLASRSLDPTRFKKYIYMSAVKPVSVIARLAVIIFHFN